MPQLSFGRYRDIAREIAERLEAARGEDSLRPWGVEVIVASRGMAESITRALLERDPRPIAGLQLQSLETLARRVLNDAGQYPRVASDAERRLAMRMAARAIDDPMMTTRGIASMLERTYRDVRDSGLTVGNLRKHARIARAFVEYEKLIAAIGAIDPAELLTRAARAVQHAAPQIVAGFYDMTGVQRAFVDALDRAGRIESMHIPAGDDDAYRFAQWGAGNLAGGGAGAPPIFDLAPSRTTDLEIRAVCDAVASLLAVGTTSVGIVARSFDAADIHLFNRFANERGFRLSQRVDIPLLSHRLGRAIATILRLRVRGFPRGEVLEIVRDGFRAQTAIDVDAADLKTRQRRRVDDYIALVAELEAFTSRLEAPLRGSEWSELLASIVSRFQFESERDLRAAECVDDVGAMFERADRMNVRFDINTVIDALEQQAITDDDTPGPKVWIGDVMTFRGRTFDHLFAVGMQDDSFPQRRIEDALLPDFERAQLGVRQVGDGSDEEKLLFRLLFDGTSEVIHFSLAASDGFGKVLRPSQLLKNFVIEQRPQDKAKLLKDFVRATQQPSNPATRQPGNPATRPLQLLARTGTRSVFDGFIPDASLFAHSLDRVTPTHLEDFGECPQKFLLKHILGVVDLDDPERELQINHRDKGSIDHRILEHFYSSLRDEDYDAAQRALPLLPESFAARLEKAVDDEFNRLEEEAPPFNRNIRAIERSATKRILRDFVARDLSELLANDLRPRHFEYTFGEKFAARGYRVDHAEPFVVTAAGAPIRVEGKIDRVDSDGTHFRIVDYKSGKALRHQDLGKKIDRGVRLQLAMYAMAVAEFFGVDASRINATIKPIVAGDAKPSSFAFALVDKRDALRETLDIFAAAILRGRFPAFPNDKESDFNSCKYCPVNHSCRTKHDAEEKYAVTRSREPRTLLREIG